jgi:hypothetical protein
MASTEILATIDREIAQLQRARALLGGTAAPALKRSVGRPRKVVAAPNEAAGVARVAAKSGKKKTKRNISAEGLKHIAEAARRRWAAHRAAAAK